MKKCQLCGNKSQRAMNRSHSNIASHRRQNVNLQWAKIKGKKMLICVRCKKSAIKK